jgi:hypothetical protein
MKSKTLGAIHPILFMATMYIITLLFSIFICSSLFYSCNTSSAKQQAAKPAATSVTHDAIAKE